MKIDIERFGPIEKFSYDLEKDLIITYGNNNIGKSYAMQIVYLLLKTFIENPILSEMGTHSLYRLICGVEPRRFEDDHKKVLQEFLNSQEAIKDITNLIIDGCYNLLEDVFLHRFFNSCLNTFGNFTRTLETNPIIRINHDQFSFNIILKENEITGTVKNRTVKLVNMKSEFYQSENYNEPIVISVGAPIDQVAMLISEKVLDIYMKLIQTITTEFNAVYFLPASRSGIYSGMSAFGSIVAELSKSRAYFTKSIEFPGISEPISDYFISLSNIKPTLNEQFSRYYSEIEDNILKGKVTFDKNKNALMYQPNNHEALFEMTKVSSMVSEISPIVAFLKYILDAQTKGEVKGKAILFIEEPEAHLHPNNQIALVEVFCELIGANVKLIMSSHSNYVFNKLNNLVLSGKLDYTKYQPIILEDLDGGSVSKALPIDDLGASDENFIDVSEKLYYEREEIIRKLN